MMRTRAFLYPVIFLCLSRSLPAQAWSGIISPGRATDWSSAGVLGGIPDAAWTQCGSTIAAYGSSGSPASAATINNALSACGANQYVQLGAGTFYLSTGVTFFGHSNVALRGMGANQTFLAMTGSDGCEGLAASICMDSTDVNYWGGPSNLGNWTAGYSAGTTSITLSSNTNLSVGSPIMLDQLDDSTALLTSGWTLNSGNVWQAALSSFQPNTVYFNLTQGTQVGSAGAITAANQWYWANNVLYVYSTSDPGTAFTNFGVAAATDTGDIFLCYAQYVCSSNGDNGGGPRPGRSQQQMVTVTSISGSGPYTIGIFPAIRMPNWTASKAPQAWWATNPISKVGVENLSVDSSNGGASVGVGFFNCVDCWVTGIRSIDPSRSHVQVFQSNRITIANNYLWRTANQSSASYGVEEIPGSDVLVQNNILQAISGPLVVTGSCSGCVLAYNFDINEYFSQPTWQQQGIYPHAVGDENMLIEGNQGAGIYSDNFHGTHHFQTVFRNNLNGFQPNNGTTTTNGLGPLLLFAYSRFYNVIGNVLGTNAAGFSNYFSAAPGNSTVIVAGFGNGVVNDINVQRTLMLWGNYDVVTAAVRWCGNSSDPGWSTTCASTSEIPSGIANYANPVPSSTALPASFYLGSRPSWWPSGKPWPAVGPDVTGGNIPGLGGHANTIPAADCYANTMLGPADGTGAVLSFNAATCYGQQTGAPPSAPTGLTVTVR
jgi:hypothetical protein